jgi:hypothetical protein
MTDPRYMNAHPDFQIFLDNHPNVATQARQMAAHGAYDEKHQWHDRNWWTANNPKWTQQHHPEWVHHPAHDQGYEVQHPAHDQGYEAQHPAHDQGYEAQHPAHDKDYEAQHPAHDKDYEAHHKHEHD